MAIDRALVHVDVQGAAGRWKLSGCRDPDTPPDLDEAVDTALAVVAGERTESSATRARFCIATKGPHLGNPQSLASVAARLHAFGVAVHALRRIDASPDHVVQSLYPRATRYFEHGPTSPAHWARLAERFDTAEFTTIFGCRYDRSLVIAGADVIRANRISPAEFTTIWEAGRQPIDRATLVARYGERAANVVLDGADGDYDWFRGALPVGISRVASAMTAFAMRDERINAGAPVIVVNGHVPGLAGLFAPATWIFELGVGADGPQISDVRRDLAGDDSRPESCRAGSLRRDAVDGLLPLGSTAELSSRQNLVHCSDGLVAGLIEVHRLLPDRAGMPDLLSDDLARGGLTDREISGIVLSDPRILPREPNGHLSDLTRGLGLADCARAVLEVVPPVFGGLNGWADGVGFDLLSDALQHALGAATPIPRAPGPGRPLTGPATPDRVDRVAGRAAIRDGRVGVLVPAGGTGGRFGGYGVPEADPARQKTLVRAFTLGGRRLSSLDIRLANVRHWDEGDGGRLPVAVMGSPTGLRALRRWRDGLDDTYRKSLRIFAQHGIYRIDTSLIGDNPRGSWIDTILRDGAGRPSLKPSGGLGLLSCFILTGLFDEWEGRGIEFVAAANGDDVGYRLDPGAIGHLVRHPDVDGIVVGVPWGWAATVRRGGVTLVARGDESGWSMDENGSPLTRPVSPGDKDYDRGGALCAVPGDAGDRLAVVDSARPAGMLFNTNQVYLRLSAIRSVLDRAGTADPLAAVRRFTELQPVTFEDKTVSVDGRRLGARQISQPFYGSLSWLERCDVMRATRSVGPGVRSSYAPLKHPPDVRFAQLILEKLQSGGDDLALAPG